MQVNNILNIATSAPGSAASPLAGSEAGVANSAPKQPRFNDVVVEQAAEVSAVSDDALHVNDPQGGIIPIPQIYGTANLIPQLSAEQYIGLGTSGIIDQSILQNTFGAEAPQLGLAGLVGLVPTENAQLAGLQILGSQQNLATSLTPQAPLADVSLQQGIAVANELGNSGLTDDAAFDTELAALQNSLAKAADPKKIEEAFNQIVAAAGKTPAEIDPKDLGKIQEMTQKYFSDKLGGEEADEAAANKKANVQGDAEVMKVANSTGAGTNVIAALSAKVGSDYAAFDSKPIDANEFAIGGKMAEFNSSKLEAQIKIVEAEQIMRSPVEQIKIKVAQGLELGMDKITIKLHPAELGKVDVEMDLDKDGKAHVRIVADRSETLEFLRRDSTDLQKSLRDVGVNADGNNLQFSLNQNRDGKGGFNENAQNGNLNVAEAADEYSVNIPQTNDEIYMAVTQGGLNLVV